ncbi:hypothetical protein OTU49_016389 [Cherax quadricarinatus]|uniref:Uncharacterized protein n=1 Tax=Cherax quadricarinatus TaxID=27406 RepID=A0AAW0Y950_CHEQU|nr:uncharacterized protein LOC128688580 [Cherax quadricarinatus]
MKQQLPQRLRVSPRSAAYLVVLVGVLRAASCEPLVAKCNPGDSEVYCQCVTKSPRGGNTVSIKCDFENKEAVVLNKELFNFRNSSLVSAYVRMVNATSVHVTKEFLQEWMQAPSAALDIWRGGNLTLESMPPLDSYDKHASYRTFAGVGIVSCNVPEVPTMFLRDRTRGGFRIKTSTVGSFRKGVLHNMKQMRYLVLEDTVVEAVDGSVATEGFVTLSRREVHSWTGLILSNVTIHRVGEGAFNLTHQSDMETAEVTNSYLGTVETGALIAAGDISVTIKGNYFQRLEKAAFQVDVTGEVKFDENVIASWAPDALEGLMCHNRTTLERNTVRVDTPHQVALNESSTPFHTSCGNPQIFLVITPSHPLAVQVTTVSTWVLAALLIILLLATLSMYIWRSQEGITRYYNRGRFPIILNGRKSSQENLPNNAEINVPAQEATEEGITNTLYTNEES